MKETNTLQTLKLYAFFISIICFLSACKIDQIQPDYVEKIAVPSTTHLNSICFYNDTIAYLVGGKRYTETLLLKSFDGGNTWQSTTSSSTEVKALYDIKIWNNKAVGVGFDGRIFENTIHSNTWNVIQTPHWEYLHSFSPVNEHHAFIAVGENNSTGSIYKVDTTYNVLKIDSFEFEITDIQFISDKIGYASGFGSILKTDNGGDSWNLLNIHGDFFKALTAFDNVVFAVGFQGSIYKSDDYGNSWNCIRDGNNLFLKQYRLTSITFKNSQIGYICGEKGILLQTRDAGKTWKEIKKFTDNHLTQVYIDFKENLWVTGENGSLFKIHIKNPF